MAENEGLTPERRHELADTIGSIRACSAGLLESADQMDSVNADMAGSLDHSRTDEQYEGTMLAAITTAQVTDHLREWAHYFGAVADNTAAALGINPAN